MNMMTTIDGMKINSDEAEATVCQASGKLKGFPTSILIICPWVPPLANRLV